MSHPAGNIGNTHGSKWKILNKLRQTLKPLVKQDGLAASDTIDSWLVPDASLEPSTNDDTRTRPQERHVAPTDTGGRTGAVTSTASATPNVPLNDALNSGTSRTSVESANLKAFLSRASRVKNRRRKKYNGKYPDHLSDHDHDRLDDEDDDLSDLLDQFPMPPSFVSQPSKLGLGLPKRSKSSFSLFASANQNNNDKKKAPLPTAGANVERDYRTLSLGAASSKALIRNFFSDKEKDRYASRSLPPLPRGIKPAGLSKSPPPLKSPFALLPSPPREFSHPRSSPIPTHSLPSSPTIPSSPPPLRPLALIGGRAGPDYTLADAMFGKVPASAPVFKTSFDLDSNLPGAGERSSSPFTKPMAAFTTSHRTTSEQTITASGGDGGAGTGTMTLASPVIIEPSAPRRPRSPSTAGAEGDSDSDSSFGDKWDDYSSDDDVPLFLVPPRYPRRAGGGGGYYQNREQPHPYSAPAWKTGFGPIPTPTPTSANVNAATASAIKTVTVRGATSEERVVVDGVPKSAPPNMTGFFPPPQTGAPATWDTQDPAPVLPLVDISEDVSSDTKRVSSGQASRPRNISELELALGDFASPPLTPSPLFHAFNSPVSHQAEGGRGGDEGDDNDVFGLGVALDLSGSFGAPGATNPAWLGGSSRAAAADGGGGGGYADDDQGDYFFGNPRRTSRLPNGGQFITALDF